MRMKRLVTFFAILFFSLGILSAVEVEPPVFRGGMLYLGTDSEDPEKAPSPLLTAAGVSLPLRFSEHLWLEPALTVHGTWYGIPDALGYPVPVINEWRESWVLSLLIDPALMMAWPVSDDLSLGFSAAPGFLFRFPLIATGYRSFDNAAALSYFFGQGRFFFPKTGVLCSWRVSENLLLRFQTDVWFPLFHAWDRTSGPFYDQLMVCLWIGFSQTAPVK